MSEIMNTVASGQHKASAHTIYDWPVGFQYRVPGSGKNREFPLSFPVFIPGFNVRVPGFETVCFIY
jgi:hypothetical protein